MDPRKKWFVYFLLMLFGWPQISSAAAKLIASEKELKGKAEQSFKSEDYAGATASYSQLLSLNPTSSEYNYHYGICLLVSGKEKRKAADYLEVASKNPKANIDVFFYLGRAYMYADKFEESLKAYDTFKKLAGSKASRYEVDKFVQGSLAGKVLLGQRKDVAVVNSQQLILYGFYSVYDYSQIHGKILSTPTQFLTSSDKDKMNDPAMFLSPESDLIYFASYGKNAKTGKDIYRVNKKSDGSWGIPENLGSVINTGLNEDYPFWDARTNTLYFASKGHQNMGGYDLFKSTYDAGTGQWSSPENIGLPVNSPDDDILYIPNSTGEYATYATNVNTEKARVEVRKIKVTPEAPGAAMAVIKGTYVSKDRPFRKDARISILRVSDNSLVTSVSTNDKNGNYEVMLAGGQEYKFILEAGGYVAHVEKFKVPPTVPTGVLKQEVKMNRENETEEMTLSNYFAPEKSMTQPSEVLSTAYRLSDSTSNPLQPMTVDGRTIFVAKVDEGHKENEAISNNEPVASVANSKSSTSPQELNKDAQVTKQGDGEVIKNQVAATELPIPGLGVYHDDSAALAVSTNQDVQHAAANKGTDKDLAASGNQAQPTGLQGTNKHTAGVQGQDVQTSGVQDSKTLTAAGVQDKSVQQGGVKNVVPDDRVQEARLQESKAHEAKVQQTETQAMVYDSASKSQLKEARALMMDGKKENIGLAQSIFRESLKNKKLADSTQMVANQMKQTGPGKTDNGVVADETANSATPNEDSQVTSESSMYTTIEDTPAGMVVTKSETRMAASSTNNISGENSGADISSDNHTVTDERNENTVSGNGGQPAVQGTSLNGTQTVVVAAQNSGGANVATTSSNKSGTDISKANDNVTHANASTAANNVTDVSLDKGGNRIASPSGEIKETGNTAMQVQTAAGTTGNLKDSKSSSGEIAKANAAMQVQTESGSTSNLKDSKSTSGELTKGNTTAQHVQAESGMTASQKTNSASGEMTSSGAEAIQVTTEPGISSNLKSSKTSAEVSSVTHADSKTAMQNTSMPVDPREEEINQALQQLSPATRESMVSYRSNMNESTRMDNEASVMVRKVQTMKSSPDRDELMKKANEKYHQSILKWHAAQQNLREAKMEDASVEEKLPPTAFVFDGKNDLRQENRATVSTTKEAAGGSGSRQDEIAAVGSSSGSSSSSSSSSSSDSRQDETAAVGSSSRQDEKAAVGCGSRQDEKAAGSSSMKQDERVAVAVASSSNQNPESRVQQPESSSQNPAARVQSPESSNQNPAARIQQSESDYKEYQAVNSQITAKQSETIRIFADALSMGQQAEIKYQEEASLRNRAANENNSARKKELNAEAIQKKKEADSLDTRAKQAMLVARSHRTEVKTLTAQNDALKKKLDSPETQDQQTTSDLGGMQTAMAGNGKQQQPLANNAATSASSNVSKSNESSAGSSVQQQVVSPAAGNGNEKKSATVKPEALTAKNTTANDTKSLQKKEDKAIAGLGTVSPETKPQAMNETAAWSSEVHSTIFSRQESTTKSRTTVPMNPMLPQGLVFKVQVGAFRTPIPAALFKGISPVSGETSRVGWIRYCVGLFGAFESARAVKSEMRSSGFRDAFVVAYFNGKRISLQEASAMINGANEKNKSAYAAVQHSEMNQLSAMHIKAAAPDNDADRTAFYEPQTVSVSKAGQEIEYAVQVGVYRTSKAPKTIASLKSIGVEKMAERKYRFITGRYSTMQEASAARMTAVQAGVKDAFLIVYKNGRRLNGDEAKKYKSAIPNQTATVSSKATIASTTKVKSQPKTSQASKPKADTSQDIYKVQLGSFRETVPVDMVNAFVNLSSQGISRENENGMQVFYVGSFKVYSEALKLKNEVIGKGIKGALVVLFSEGKKVQASVANQDFR